LINPLNFIRQRFSNRGDAEHVQAMIRLGIVSTAMVYFHSAFFVSSASSEEKALWAHYAVTVSWTITLVLFAAVLWRPAVSVPRRVSGTVHDIIAISVAMYLGEGSAAAVVVIYLWSTLGNGFRYGVPYLYGSAALSIAGFGVVFLISDYWQSQRLLSINIFLLLTLVPPYVARLLKSLAEAQAALQQRASFDTLTGLMNRLEFEERLEALLATDRNGHFLLFCDLDFFKTVNDEAGHAAGDKLLADIGQIIEEAVRKDDLTARLGGDEFAVLLRHCPQERARAIAESIRNSVSGYRLAWGTEYYQVGVSVGVAPSAAVKDIDSLFRLADAACYAAKNAGRNQIHVIDARARIEDTQAIRNIAPDSGAKQRTGRPAVTRRAVSRLD